MAKKQKHSLSLTVDGVTVTTENPYSSSTSAETKNPIYVGGYPGMEFLSPSPDFKGPILSKIIFMIKAIVYFTFYAYARDSVQCA